METSSFCVSPLSVYIYGQPCLRGMASPVTAATDLQALQATLNEMASLLNCTGPIFQGAALSGPQINQPFRYFVTEDGPFINPVINAQEGSQTIQDGCMSIPGLGAMVTRALSLTLTYDIIVENSGVYSLQTIRQATSIGGNALSGERAFIIQHEIDHLNGILYTDPIRLTSPPPNLPETLQQITEGKYPGGFTPQYPTVLVS